MAAGEDCPDARTVGWQSELAHVLPRQSCPHVPQFIGSVVVSAPAHPPPVPVLDVVPALDVVPTLLVVVLDVVPSPPAKLSSPKMSCSGGFSR